MRTYRGQRIDSYYLYDDLTVGTFALVDHTDRHGNCYWTLDTDYPVKNMSGEPCKRGWCGSTNDHSITAAGCVTVYRDTSGRLRIKPAPDDALVVALDGDDVADARF